MKKHSGELKGCMTADYSEALPKSFRAWLRAGVWYTMAAQMAFTAWSVFDPTAISGLI